MKTNNKYVLQKLIQLFDEKPDLDILNDYEKFKKNQADVTRIKLIKKYNIK